MSTRGDYGERIKLGTHTAKARVHALVVFSILVLALLGRMLDSQAGWITCPPPSGDAGCRRPAPDGEVG